MDLIDGCADAVRAHLRRSSYAHCRGHWRGRAAGRRCRLFRRRADHHADRRRRRGRALYQRCLFDSVQGSGRTRSSLLPADIVYRPSWTIYIPASEVPKNGIRDRDILIDDDGYRYGVAAAMWTSLGWNLECVRLEA